MSHSRSSRSPGFTLVDVMMAATILVVAFVGMIEAVAISSNMMDTARRQALAYQIINHEIERLRLASWSTVSGLPTTSTSVPIDCPFWPTWNSASRYSVNSVVTFNGAWYRCILGHSNEAPPNPLYWVATTSGLTSDIVVAGGATYSLSRTLTSPDPVSNLREINFTVTWAVSTSRRDDSGTPVSFTYSRTNSAWFGKYGLNLTYQRS